MTASRARDLGIRIGSGEPGPANAITDVTGVRVGHRTVLQGDDGAPDAVLTPQHLYDIFEITAAVLQRPDGRGSYIVPTA